MAGKGTLHVVEVDGTDRLYMSVQTGHGVLHGEKIALCGGGKFHPAAAANEKHQTGHQIVWPDVKEDNLVVFRDQSQNPKVDKVMTLRNLIVELALAGKVDPKKVMSKRLMWFGNSSTGIPTESSSLKCPESISEGPGDILEGKRLGGSMGVLGIGAISKHHGAVWSPVSQISTRCSFHFTCTST